MTLALVFFAVAAVIGLFMAIKVLSGATPPWALSLLHAALGAGGIITLFFALRGSPIEGPASISLGVFVVAALGGFLLASFHLRGKTAPGLLVGIHGLAAVAAFALLAAVSFSLI